MNAPYISVVITAYNYGRFIEEAVDSVLSQDFPQHQFEVLVVDDGSTDDTAQRLKKYGSPVHYLYQQNCGQASALNRGFASARGEIISLLDGDDFFLPGKLSRVAEAFRNDPSLGMVYHPMEGWDIRTGERRRTPFPLISGSALENEKKFFWYEAPGTCASYRRSFLNLLLPIPEEIRMLADAFPGGLIVFVAPVLALPECLSVYRVHGTNSFQVDETKLSDDIRRKKQRLWQIAFNRMNKWLSEHGFTREQPAVRDMLDRWILYLGWQEFLLKPPRRMEFFRHLSLYNRCYGPHISPRLRLINRFNAAGALLTGYKHFHILDDLRLKAVSFIRRRGDGRGR